MFIFLPFGSYHFIALLPVEVYFPDFVKLMKLIHRLFIPSFRRIEGLAEASRLNLYFLPLWIMSFNSSTASGSIIS